MGLALVPDAPTLRRMPRRRCTLQSEYLGRRRCGEIHRDGVGACPDVRGVIDRLGGVPAVNRRANRQTVVIPKGIRDRRNGASLSSVDNLAG